ncbi:MAG TPA: flagellar biosynthetic protein FliO [Dyella sp.]|uniref:flagellar biosynthetic protein FliO n=1 Tax=Dyella sp. TaxID=1869338 RepID=UPI002F95F20B
MLMALAAVAPVAGAPDVDVGGELLRVLVSLAAIVAIILAAGWFTRRMQGRAQPGGRRIRCVESFAIGSRDRLLLIEADGKRLLVGAGQGGMRTLHVYDGDLTPPAATAIAAPGPGFAELLNRWKRKP